MAKQIYIDSNGNEVLVSGTITNDNNLPHYTGTPTEGSTAEAIGDKQDKLSYKEYSVQIGTTLWNGVYYTEINVSTDVSSYGAILSALVIDESEQSDFSSHTNRPCFCQVISPNIIRVYSPQASNASEHYVKFRVTFGANAVNRT